MPAQAHFDSITQDSNMQVISLLAGLREDFAKFKAERQKSEEPIEAKVLSAILSSSATPYR